MHRGCWSGGRRPGVAVVLSIGKLGGSPEQLEYYERQVAAGIEDYYTARGEAPGRWIGGGCGGLGLSGRVERDEFLRLMDGRDPGSGEVLRPRHGRMRLAAFDLTFSAPKSVSVLFAIGGEEMGRALVEAHDRAVDEALEYVEREARFTRRGRNGVRRVQGEGFVGAAYRHRLSRAGDPQLHTHVVVANMTRAEGRWTALDGHGLYEHKSAAGAVYRAVLRAEVRQRMPWVKWRGAGRGLFEIEGMPAGVLREFSRRRVEIEERAVELAGVGAGELSRERLQGIALATRRAKDYGVDRTRWREEARARAAEHGLGERELQGLTSVLARAAALSPAEVAGLAAARLSAPDGLTSKYNTFARRHVIAELAGEFTQGASVRELEAASDAYLGDQGVVCLGGDEAERRYTTAELLACEQAILESARRRVRGRVAVLNPALVEAAVLGWSLELTDEQATMVRTAGGSGNGVEVIQALAGTGKTSVLGALASCYRQAGYRVVSAAPTGRAARELGEATGTAAGTLHALVAALERASDLAPDTVVLLDEAGMAPTRQSAALFAAAERAGSKIIAAGDGGQLPSVQAGGWFTTLARELGGPELRTVIRQRDAQERAALEALHDGRPDEYIEFKQRQGALAVHADERGAMRELLAEWDAARAAHGLDDIVMIAPDNATRASLNEQARARLIAGGILGSEAVVIAGVEFRVGERVIARRNDRYRDVDNGTRATVRAIDPLTGALTVQLDAGGLRRLDATYVAEHLERAYALTGHGTQGATVEWAAVMGRPAAFTAEWAYTALSRARGQTRLHVIADPSARLREREELGPRHLCPTPDEALNNLRLAMTRHEAEQLAIEHAEPAEVPAQNQRRPRLSPGELAEADAERAATLRLGVPGSIPGPSRAPGWRALRQQRERTQRGPRLQP